MRIRLIRKEDQPKGTWAGGTTTQLAIGPEGADYASRRFEWRISSARVDLDASDFTPLPGFRRILMILEGNVHLTHEGVREIHLAPFEQDVFEGAWRTRSRGRCVDFNLMTAEGWTGSVAALCSPDGKTRIDTPLLGAAEAFYCLQDDTAAAIGGGSWSDTLKRGDFLLIESPDPGAVLSVGGRSEKPVGVHARVEVLAG